jgi:hypothetical protein
MRVIGRPVRRRQSVDRDEVIRMVRRLMKRGRAAGLSAEEICSLIQAASEELHRERAHSQPQ